MEVDNLEQENGVAGGIPLAAEAELTETENELYDRQIRLWGLESQKRLRTAKVLISGLSGVGAEVTKNIILSGVNSVTLHDDSVITEEDFCSQFLAPRSSLGTNRAVASIERAQKLNPMVPILADTESLSKKGADFFKQFDVVVILGAPSSELIRIDEICRENGIKFFSGAVWGMFGYCFADLQDHAFIEDVVKHKVISKPNEKTKTELVVSTVKRELKFPPYSSVLEHDINSPKFLKKLRRTGPAFVLLRVLQKFVDNFNRHPSPKSREADIAELQRIRGELGHDATLSDEYFENVFAQISPAAAVVGGILAQEVIKVITKKESPHQNVFLFDPDKSCGFVETVGV